LLSFTHLYGIYFFGMTSKKKTTTINQTSQESRKSQLPGGDTSSENEIRAFEKRLQNMLGKDLFQRLKKTATRENKSVEQVFKEQYTYWCDLAEMGVITVNDPANSQEN
jgi:hypothetical protein